MPDANYFAKQATDYIESLRSHSEKLEAENLSLKQPFGVIRGYEHFITSQRSYDVTKRTWPKHERKRGWDDYEQDYRSDLEIAKRNDATAHENSQIVDRILELISKTGFRDKVIFYKRNKRTEETADWKSYLLSAIPANPGGVAALERSYAEKKRKFEEAQKAEESAERDRLRKQEAEERNRRNLVRIVEVATALGVDPATADYQSLKEEIRKRDKYLDLAIAGIDTRGDWSYGPCEVEDALSRFNVESPHDGEISSSWSAMCQDFEDGRCFRDCEWNYDRVMCLARPEIVALWSKLNEC